MCASLYSTIRTVEEKRSWTTARADFASTSPASRCSTSPTIDPRPARNGRARTVPTTTYRSRCRLERFGQVLAIVPPYAAIAGDLRLLTRTAKPMQTAQLPRADTPARIDAGISSLSEELNREDSQLRSLLLDAALAGLRLERNPESPPLRLDAAQIWAVIEPILSHHLDVEENDLLPWLERQRGSRTGGWPQDPRISRPPAKAGRRDG